MKLKIFVLSIILLSVTLFADEYNPTTLVVPPFEHTFGYSKITPSALKMAVGGKVTLNDPQGISVVKLRALDDRSTSGDDDELTMFVVNSGTNKILYNIGFKGFGSYGKFGTKDGEFWNPQGISANSRGGLWVADTKNDRIVKLYCDGKNIEFLKSIGEFGMFDGEFDAPQDVAQDGRRRVYVADTGNDRIQVFSKDGEFLYSFSGTADLHLNKPIAVAAIDKAERWSFYRDESNGFIVVVDDNGTRIVKFNMEGKALVAVSTFSLDIENASLKDVAIDYYSNIYVVDENNSQIHIFDRNLEFITSFGRKGTGKAEFVSPRAISIWKRYGQVFILEQNGGQYYWVGVDAYVKGVFPSIFGEEEPGATISIFITQPAHIYIDIYSEETDELVRTLIPKLKRSTGEENIVWNGLNNEGELVSPGKYRIEVVLKPTYSSKGKFEKKVTCFAERR
jgi:DNA-binding beta-propeller fold protein YncE